MNKIDELIKEKCPNGVEYKTIEDITTAINIGINPRRFFKLNPEDAEGFYVTVRELNGLQGVVNTSKTDQISLDAVRIIQNRANIEQGDILFSNTGTVGKMALVQETPRNWGVNEGIYVIKPKKEEVDSRFLYYYLASTKAVKDYSSKFTGSTLKHVTQKALASLTVPVPPLEIQQEIVGILNSFTELEAELEAELTKRKQQYEHYRDHLLSFENIAGEGGQVEWFALGDIATVTKLAGFEFTKYVTYSNSGNVIALRGLNVKNGQLDLKDVKYIDKSDLSKLNRSKLVIGDMLFTYVGTVGQVALISENEKYYLAPNVSVIRLNDKNAIMPKYLMYYFQTNTFRSSQIDRLLQASSMQNIPMEKIRKFNIPVPSKKIQERIVYVLDNFDSVCNDLKIGLPAEIEARQKQYEYYRDRLLSFDAAVGGGTEREREE